jgi:hypothetical protein
MGSWQMSMSVVGATRMKPCGQLLLLKVHMPATGLQQGGKVEGMHAYVMTADQQWKEGS